MTLAPVDNPVGKLALAVVTQPQRAPNPFAPPPQPGLREEAIRHLLQTGAEAGVGRVATRPAGDDERLLGQAWPFPSPFAVTVRTVSAEDGPDRVEARARRSLERLGLPRGDVLLVSDARDLLGADGRGLWDRLQGLKTRGLYRRIGVCATMEDGPVELARRLSPDVIQLPCNLFDQRAVQTGALHALAARGVAVHLSSVFARGLLFAGGDAGHPAEQGLALSRARRRLAEARLDPMQGALAFALSVAEAEAVIASVASSAELRAVLAAAHAPTPALDWSAFAVAEPTARSMAAPSKAPDAEPTADPSSGPSAWRVPAPHARVSSAA